MISRVRIVTSSVLVCACVAPSILAGCEGGEDDPAVVRTDGPRYETQRYMPGLAEWVTIIKTPSQQTAIRASGAIQDLQDLWEEDEDAWRELHGRASVQLATRLAAAPSSEIIPVLVMFRPDVQVEGLSRPFMGPELRRALTDERRASHERVGEALIQRLEGEGFSLNAFNPAVPWFIGTADARTLERLAKVDGVEAMFDATPGEVVLHQAPPNSVSEPQIDIVFNDNGYWGSGQRVGNLEGACYTWTEHEAFTTTGNVEFKDPGSTFLQCDDDGDCPSKCKDVAKCKYIPERGANYCVSEHQTMTASVIKASNGGLPYGAAAATLYVANGLTHELCGGSGFSAGIVPSYEWFRDNDVPTVYESWGCVGNITLDGLTQDYFARKEDILVIKSAGNSDSADHNPSNYENRACPLMLNGLCVGATKSGGVGMMEEHAAIDPLHGSTWLNPDLPSGSDREEPDIAVFGSSVLLAQLDSTTSWSTMYPGTTKPLSGTSFAAPLVASEATLLREVCERAEHQYDSWVLFARAVFQAAAWAKNPEGAWYSTVSWNPPNDWRDGAGYPYAGPLAAFCDSGPGNGPPGGSETGTIDLGESDKPPEGEGCEDCGGTPPGEPQTYTMPASDDLSFNWRQVGVQVELQAGSRIRAVYVWHSFPYSPVGSGPSPRGVDFDLFLVHDDATGSQPRYPFGSMSIDDVSEGFDVEVAHDGKYSAWVRWPSSGPGSNCDEEPNEPYAFAWVTPP